MKDEHIRGMTVLRGQCIKACTPDRHEEPDFCGDKRIHEAKLLFGNVADESPDFLELLAIFCLHSTRVAAFFIWLLLYKLEKTWNSEQSSCLLSFLTYATEIYKTRNQ